MPRIFHITRSTDWRAAQHAGAYTLSTRDRTLQDVGFIHCSYAHQVAGVANAIYHGERDLVLLTIDPRRLSAPLRPEPAESGGAAYPHIYGPLNLDAVVEVRPYPPSSDGTFLSLSAVDPILLEIPAVLRGERIIVRMLEDDDAQMLFEAIDESREHLARWMPWAKDHVSIDDSLSYIRRSHADWLVRRRLPVGIVELASGRLIGGSGLERIDWQVRSFEIGYWLRVSAEGRGFAQETVRLLTRLAFDQLDANRVEIRMDARNQRSERVAQRAGFAFEGTLRNAALDSRGAPADRQVYALTPESYERVSWRHSP
jgi:RimJ/RimL family protein N-acetyltransferase